ncbi:MAG: acyl--CoA ligase, partial [Deltaproteobacteria bacterium]|nr:acyl--CoA ligase [Deltaproteobacteria bacterium]
MAERAETNVRQIVHRAARWYPANEAVVDGIQRLTYAELQDQVRRMAALLHSLGVRKGDRVALLMHPSAAHVIALFGAIELGAIPCALHLRESAALLQAVVERLSPRVLVYDAALDELASELQRRVPLITGAVRAASAISPPEKLEAGSDPLIPRDLANWEMDFEPMPIAEDETAAIVLSSGTTGVPKGIMHSHRALVESARGGAQLWRINARSSIINLSTTAFIGWYNCALPFLNASAKLVFQNQWDPQQYLETCQRERTTVAFLVPTMWRMVMKLPVEDYDLGAIRLAGYAGEPIDAGTLRAIQERVCPDVLNMYGTTETGSCAGGTVLY